MRPWMKMSTLRLVILSLMLTCAVIGNAFRLKQQFYPAIVYLTRSHPSMMVLYIQGFVLVYLFGKLMKKIFFGNLRPVELERLTERSWYALTETCLAFTLFRDDFTPKFVALFTLLLFLKAFHWLADERVDFMERSPVIFWPFHIRTFSLLLLLANLDVYLIVVAYDSTVATGPSVQMIFGFEYSILLTVAVTILIKYLSHVRDLNQGNWENKAVFILYTDLVMGLVKLLLYILFIVTMFRLYTLPLFALRPMYFTVRSFKKALHDVIMSRRALKNLSNLYPDATREELEREDVCIICREELQSNAKKLPCNHVFHTSCLRSWFQRQQTCPTCRFDILVTSRNPTSQRNAPPENQPNRPQEQRQAQQQAPPQPGAYGFPFAQAPNMEGQPLHFQPFVPSNLPYFVFPLRFPIPPPMPPPPFLSEEDIRLIQQNTREGLEARMACLHNISCMIDASLIMMTQYFSIITESQRISQSFASTSAQTTRDEAVQVDLLNETEAAPPFYLDPQQENASPANRTQTVQGGQ